VKQSCSLLYLQEHNLIPVERPPWEIEFNAITIDVKLILERVVISQKK